MYHITAVPPEEILNGNKRYGVLIPQKYGRCRALNERNYSRVCLAPTIYQCFLAFPFVDYYKLSVWQYAYGGKIIKPNKLARGIEDIEYTDEHWLVKPAKFKFLGEIESPKWYGEDGCGDREWARRKRNYIRKMVEKKVIPALTKIGPCV